MTQNDSSSSVPALDAACPCGSGQVFGLCCGPYLSGEAAAPTAEALMRSRYSAYVCQKISYLKDTLWPKYQPGFDAVATAAWAAESRWTGLKVLGTTGGQAADRDGTVLFEARYLAGAKLNTHRELSRFRKKAGRWYYVEAIEEK
ncbi:YchJ family protein [Roseibium suaedae]|uniref:SEC-C motif-containing protein n=1 Tax=Roseibium suaedae TaxID=735517 RepID=A0A1M7N571_9HYPH|nr:YchJ family metal-binding protein [Roseibium suaedae]SHM98139.1 SEC-C motif-containing protein [Roseibium suaedae]